MLKIIFMPVSILAGLVSGALSRKLFSSLWGLIDEQRPPQPDQRRIDIRKLVLALSIEGALFRLVKGLVDHGSRVGFTRLTGSWPGRAEEEDPQSA